MEPKKNAPEETLEDLYKQHNQAAAEQDFEMLLQITSKIQRLTEARRSKKKPQAG
jgi:hypothetical protein